MTKYYNHIHRNFTNLRPDVSSAVWHYSGVEDSYSDIDAMFDNELTARQFFGLFESISLELPILDNDVIDLVRSSLLTLLEVSPEWLDEQWCCPGVQEWIVQCAQYSTPHRIKSKSGTTALRRLLMLSLLLSDDCDMRKSRPWVFLYRYGIPFDVVDGLDDMCRNRNSLGIYRWNKLQHAASVGLRCLIDSYALLQGGLLHDVDKTDGDGELHLYHLSGHHNLGDDFALFRFVEASHDAAETYLTKGDPCIIQNVDGMRNGVKDSLLIFSSTPMCPPDNVSLEYMDDEEHDEPIEFMKQLSHQIPAYVPDKYYSKLLDHFKTTD